MTDKKISIVIPFYNNVNWLSEAVESILAQTYTNYEIILVNDGSPEDLTDFLNKYRDRITYIVQENKGPGAARNNGIRHATGEYVAFEDADDVWLPTKLEKQLAFMEESGVKWSHTGFYYWYPESGKQVVIDNSHVYDDILLQRMVATKIATPTVMIKREVFVEDKCFFPEETRNGEDDQLYTIIAGKYKMGLIQEPLIKVRMRGSNSFTKIVERFHLRNSNFNKWRRSNVEMPFMVHFIYVFYRFYARMFPLKSGSNAYVQTIAKCMWAIPFSIERLYLRYLYLRLNKDPKYISPFDYKRIQI